MSLPPPDYAPKDLPPGNPPLTSTEGLNLGDVVLVSRRMEDRVTHDVYWWKRFACVTRLLNPLVDGRNLRYMRVLYLRLNFAECQEDVIKLGGPDRVVTLVPDHMLPQGVAAMKMKHIALGHIKLNTE